MFNTKTTQVAILAVITLLMSACRSTKQMSSFQSTTSSFLSQTIDSAAQSILNSRKVTTAITFLPMQTPGQLNPTTPDNSERPIPTTSNLPAPIQDIANALIEQGGGTLIITQVENAQSDTTTITHTTTHEQTQKTSENHETQTQSNPPRASPILDKILYILIAATILIIVARCRIKQ